MPTESTTKPEDHARVIVLFGVKGSGKDTVGDLLRERYFFTKDSFAAPLKRMVAEAFDFTEEDLYGPSSGRERQYEQYPFEKGRCLSCGANNAAGYDGENGGCWMPCDAKGRHIAGRDESEEAYVRCTRCNAIFPNHINPRIALQTLGTEWGRRLFKHVWVDKAHRRLKERVKRNHETLRNNTHLLAPGRSIEDVDYRFVFTDGRFISEHERCTKLGWTTVLLLRKLDESTDVHASEAELKQIPRSAFNYVLDNRVPLEQLPDLVTEMMTLLGYSRRSAE